MYHLIEEKLAAGSPVIIDGGTGTEIQRRGAPMSGQVWCADANLTHPEIVKAVHADYIRAGAEVIIANTYASSPLNFDYFGRVKEIAKIDGIAIDIARAAANESAAKSVTVAASFSTMRPVTPGGDRTLTEHQWPETKARELMRLKAGGLAAARPDFIVMEIVRDLDYSLMATEAAVATGLPVWVGFSVERRADGKLAGFGRDDWALADIVAPLMATGAKAAIVMHTSANNTDEALDIVSAHWKGPLGAYPESGYFKMPDWQFVDIISPGELVACARRWRRMGVTLFGGCCGIGPEHIKALADAMGQAGERAP